LNLPGIKPICPDIAVFFGIEKHRGWSIFDVEAEHAQIALVIEVTSASTRSNDVVKKFDYYHRAGVLTYVIVDSRIENLGTRRLELLGYRHTSNGYEKMPLDADGRIWLEALGVWLGIVQDRNTGFDRVACLGPITNSEIGDYTAVTQARIRAEAQAAAAEAQAAAAEARANAESEARAAAEARIRELEAALKTRPSPDA
jgi:hypothetical protein